MLARLLGKSTSTLRAWRRRAGTSRRPGRPRHSDEARREARAQVERIGPSLLAGHDGWRSAQARLEREHVVVPTRLIQESVALRKRARRAAERAERAAERVHVEVLARDALWALDQTRLVRDEAGALDALCVRECCVPHTLGLSIGPPARGGDVVRLLVHTAEERGAWPFVLQADNGPENKNAEVQALARERRVIILWNEPRTPEHNARAERTHQSLKRASGLPTRRSPAARAAWRGVSRARVCQTLVAAWQALDQAPRASLEGLSPVELDSLAPRAEDCACRARFYAEVCAELEAIARAPNCARARRKLEREAVWRALERYGLVSRTRGGRHLAALEAEAFS